MATPLVSPVTAKMMPHMLTAGTMLVVGGIAWGVLQTDVGNAEDEIKENSEKIEAIQEQMHEIDIKQATIIQEQEFEAERAKDFRDRTDQNLQTLIQKIVPAAPIRGPNQ